MAVHPKEVELLQQIFMNMDERIVCIGNKPKGGGAMFGGGAPSGSGAAFGIGAGAPIGIGGGNTAASGAASEYAFTTVYTTKHYKCTYSLALEQVLASAPGHQVMELHWE